MYHSFRCYIAASDFSIGEIFLMELLYLALYWTTGNNNTRNHQGQWKSQHCGMLTSLYKWDENKWTIAVMVGIKGSTAAAWGWVSAVLYELPRQHWQDIISLHHRQATFRFGARYLPLHIFHSSVVLMKLSAIPPHPIFLHNKRLKEGG